MPESADGPSGLFHPPRRSATLPTRLISQEHSLDRPKETDNILFYHPSAKIVHFSPRAVAPIPPSTAPLDFDYPVDTIETLPWRSSAERTVALAPLRLENIHGLTVFLKCGSVVQAILKNSQCWCVDGESTFVLRIRPLTYYRIEIPNHTETDQEYVEDLRRVLPTVLRYEITPCPFRRGFTVEIPEEAKVPKRKKAWRPKRLRESAPAALSAVQESNDSETSEPGVLSVTEESSPDRRDSNAIVLDTIPDDNDGSTESEPVAKPEPRRAVSETQADFHTLRGRFEATPEPHVDNASLSSSFESCESAPSLSPLIPPSSSHSNSTCSTSIEAIEHLNDLHDGRPVHNNVPELRPSHRDVNRYRASNVEHLPCKVPSKVSAEESSKLLSAPAVTTTPIPASTTSANDLSEMSMQFRRRASATKERDLSPMPPSSILCPPRPHSQDEGTASIIQKTIALVLVPPIQLLLILLHITARIMIAPALDSAIRDSSKRENQVDYPQEAVDDFDLPLTLESSNDTDSQGSTRPDVWDLD